MIVSAHQSQYLPWLPYFKKVACSDVFVWMDNVQYHRGGLQNRTHIWSNSDSQWLSLSVHKGRLSDLICEKKIKSVDCYEQQIKLLTSVYQHTKYFEQIMPQFVDIYSQLSMQDENNLDVVNYAFFKKCVSMLNIDTKVVRLSELQISSQKNQLVLDLSTQLNATTYISGSGAKDYLNIESFEAKGISVQFLASKPPVYKSTLGEFVAGLSIVDMLMNEGIESVKREVHD